ncbi:bacteriocin [Dongia sp.]|uniref:bacteriocin n=1 Tax=Dongia sp. TaxID=1977262 RepID=UPI0037502A49
MSKETSKKDPQSLVKASPEGSIELSEKELQQVAGGQKVKGEQQEYLKIKLTDILISG